VKPKELIQALKKLGFYEHRQRGTSLSSWRMPMGEEQSLPFTLGATFQKERSTASSKISKYPLKNFENFSNFSQRTFTPSEFTKRVS